MKLRAYLVDDEPLALERLKRLLSERGQVEVTGSTTLPEEAVAAMTTNPPDVCFLDIQMPRLNGFEVLARLPVQPAIIFTTAYDEYALRAFAVNSVDYLLKPLDPLELDRALAKIERLRQTGTAAQPDLTAQLKDLMEELRKNQPEYPSRIASRLGDRLWFIDLDQVTHFYAEDKLTYAVAEGKAYSVDHSISELEKKLDPHKFVRIHRSTMVNAGFIKEITSLPGGGLNLRLRDSKSTDLTVARDRARELKERLGC